MRALIRRAVVVAAAGAAVAVPAVAASAAQAPAVSWSPTTSPGTYDYGTVNAGSFADQTFTLRNSGGAATAALRITVSGSRFSIPFRDDRCTGTSLGPGKSCTVTVRYAPVRAGQNDTGALTATSPKITASLALRGASNTVTVTNPGNQASTVGTAVSLQIQTTDTGSRLTLTYSATGLPAGLSISSSGLITGTPTTAATSNTTVTVKDSDGGSGSASFTWTVNPASNTVTVTNPGNQTSTVGTAVSLQISATDSASGQTLTYSATGLPAGLSISSSGLITGTPTTAATSNTTVTAKDTTGASGSASFTWTVSSQPYLMFNAAAEPTGQEVGAGIPGGTAGQFTPDSTALIEVDAYDSSGTIDTTFNGPVTLTIDPNSGFASASLVGTTTVDAVNGIALFSGVTIGTQGVYELDANASGYAMGVSSQFDVIPDGGLTTAAPGNTVMATAMDPTTGETATITFTNSSSDAEYVVIAFTPPSTSLCPGASDDVIVTGEYDALTGLQDLTSSASVTSSTGVNTTTPPYDICPA